MIDFGFYFHFIALFCLSILSVCDMKFFGKQFYAFLFWVQSFESADFFFLFFIQNTMNSKLFPRKHEIFRFGNCMRIVRVELFFTFQ